MNFDPRNRQHLLLVIAIVMVGLFVGDRILFTPLFRAWKARSERIGELKKDVRHGDMLITRARAIQETWDKMRTNALPPETTLAESQILRAFDRWSKTSGVSVSSIRPQWKRAGDDYMTLECRADVAGSLAEIARLLYEIERDPLGVKVDTADLATRDTDGALITLALQVSGLQLLPKTQ